MLHTYVIEYDMVSNLILQLLPQVLRMLQFLFYLTEDPDIHLQLSSSTFKWTLRKQNQIS